MPESSFLDDYLNKLSCNSSLWPLRGFPELFFNICPFWTASQKELCAISRPQAFTIKPYSLIFENIKFVHLIKPSWTAN